MKYDANRKMEPQLSGGLAEGVRVRFWHRFSVILFLWFFLLGNALAGSISPVRAALEPEGGQLFLSSRFDVDIGDYLDGALHRGVSLYFQFQFRLRKPRWYWLDQEIASTSIQYRLLYNPMNNQYRLYTGLLPQDFLSLNDALNAIGRVAVLPVYPSALLAPRSTYHAMVRLIHDRNQLPKPLQLDALANSDLQIESTDFQWVYISPDAP